MRVMCLMSSAWKQINSRLFGPVEDIANPEIENVLYLFLAEVFSFYSSKETYRWLCQWVLYVFQDVDDPFAYNSFLLWHIFLATSRKLQVQKKRSRC